MPGYVLLNFEDPIGNYSGALQSSVAGIGVKANVKGHQVQTFDCVELITRYITGQPTPITAPDLTALQVACVGADKIYVVIHGDPRRGTVGLTTNMQQLCTAAQLAVFMLRIVPARQAQYTISMIMCYGARSATWQHALVDHQGKMPAQVLSTSFAYQLFKEICTLRDIRLTARTGRVNHNAQSGVVYVEEDMAIDEYIATDEYNKDIIANRAQRQAPVDAAKTQFLLNGGNDQQWTAMFDKHRLNANAPAVGPQEMVIKPFVAWLYHGKQATVDAYDAAWMQAGNIERAKYGKLVYTYTGGKLKVVNKYGNPHDKKIKAGYVLYSGPLL